MSFAKVFGSKSVCIITGASRGIGRAIAVAFSTKFSPDSILALTGRSADDLIETRRLVQAAAPGVVVRLIVADLSKSDTLSDTFASLTDVCNPLDYHHLLLINNAASINDMSEYMRGIQTLDVDRLQEYFMLNLTSVLLMTNHVLRTFPKRDGFRRTVVNVSSLAALQPMKTCGLYCIGKAARDMMFKVTALEEPDVRVLNYAPGPVDTDMYRKICHESADQELREMMIGVETNNVLLKPHQTAATLANILEEDSYESGTHIDYFDVQEKEGETAS